MSAEVIPYTPSHDVAVVQQQAHMQTQAVQRLGEWAQSAIAAHEVATSLVETSFVPQQFRGKPHEATAAILAGAEVGLSPMASLRSFDVIQGTAAARALTLRAIVQSQGHEMVLAESTATRCRMRGKRRGSGEWQEVLWTIDRAQALGLTGKDNWKKQPGAMLLARATSELARLIAADAILGIGYTVEELGDGADPQSTPGYEPQPDAAPEPSSAGRVMSRTRRTQEEPVVGVAAPSEDETEESPLLNTSSSLAKAMYAAFNEYGITDRDARLAYVAKVAGREISSSSDMTEAEARQVIDAMRNDLERPFGEADA
jgi:hypothetical protein